MGVKKYFIAIVIPAPLREKIEGLKHDLFVNNQLKAALRSPAHITLHRPFEWKEENEKVLIDKLDSFLFEHTFDIELYGFDCFEPRVIYVNVMESPSLTQLHIRLKRFAARELKLFNELEDERGFDPHITLAFRDLKKPLFYKLQEEFKKKQIQGLFRYSGFSLLKLDQNWREVKTFNSKIAN